MTKKIILILFLLILSVNVSAQNTSTQVIKEYSITQLSDGLKVEFKPNQAINGFIIRMSVKKGITTHYQISGSTDKIAAGDIGYSGLIKYESTAYLLNSMMKPDWKSPRKIKEIIAGGGEIYISVCEKGTNNCSVDKNLKISGQTEQKTIKPDEIKTKEKTEQETEEKKEEIKIKSKAVADAFGIKITQSVQTGNIKITDIKENNNGIYVFVQLTYFAENISVNLLNLDGMIVGTAANVKLELIEDGEKIRTRKTELLREFTGKNFYDLINKYQTLGVQICGDIEYTGKRECSQLQKIILEGEKEIQDDGKKIPDEKEITIENKEVQAIKKCIVEPGEYGIDLTDGNECKLLIKAPEINSKKAIATGVIKASIMEKGVIKDLDPSELELKGNKTWVSFSGKENQREIIAYFNNPIHCGKTIIIYVNLSVMESIDASEKTNLKQQFVFTISCSPSIIKTKKTGIEDYFGEFMGAREGKTVYTAKNKLVIPRMISKNLFINSDYESDKKTERYVNYNRIKEEGKAPFELKNINKENIKLTLKGFTAEHAEEKELFSKTGQTMGKSFTFKIKKNEEEVMELKAILFSQPYNISENLWLIKTIHAEPFQLWVTAVETKENGLNTEKIEAEFELSEFFKTKRIEFNLVPVDMQLELDGDKPKYLTDALSYAFSVVPAKLLDKQVNTIKVIDAVYAVDAKIIALEKSKLTNNEKEAKKEVLTEFLEYFIEEESFFPYIKKDEVDIALKLTIDETPFEKLSLEEQEATEKLAGRLALLSEKNGLPEYNNCFWLKKFKVNNLKCLSVVIDPGHGGADNTGTAVSLELIDGEENREMQKLHEEFRIKNKVSSKELVHEKHLTYALALKLEKKLKEKGATVIKTKQSADEEVGSTERAEIANQQYEDLIKNKPFIIAHRMMSIHINECENYDGMEIYIDCNKCKYPYKLGTDLVRCKMRNCTEYKKESKELAESLSDELKPLFENEHTLSTFMDFGPLNGLKQNYDIKGVLVEYGFICNPEHLRQLLSEEGQDKIVERTLAGIEKNYFENEFKETIEGAD